MLQHQKFSRSPYDRVAVITKDDAGKVYLVDYVKKSDLKRKTRKPRKKKEEVKNG